MEDRKLYVRVVKYGRTLFIGPCEDERITSRLREALEAKYSYFDSYQNRWEYTALVTRRGEPQPGDSHPIAYRSYEDIERILDG